MKGRNRMILLKLQHKPVCPILSPIIIIQILILEVMIILKQNTCILSKIPKEGTIRKPEFIWVIGVYESIIIMYLFFNGFSGKICIS